MTPLTVISGKDVFWIEKDRLSCHKSLPFHFFQLLVTKDGKLQAKNGRKMERWPGGLGAREHYVVGKIPLYSEGPVARVLIRRQRQSHPVLFLPPAGEKTKGGEALILQILRTRVLPTPSP